MEWPRIWFIIGLLFVGSPLWAQTKTWELNDKGEWTNTSATQAAAAPAPVANPVLDRVRLLLKSSDFDRAHDVVLAWLKTNAKAPDRDQGLFLMAETYYALGQRVECFYELDELMDTQPESKLFFPALELQYRVADDYLRGVKNTFLGMPIIPMDDTGIEMMYRIQERAPGAPIAERALRRTADFYYHTSQFDVAADAYGAFLRIYPRSPEVPQARLRQAFSNFAQFRGPRYDITPLLDARAEFVEITVRTPELAQERDVQKFIDRIDEQLSAKIASDADYYMRVHNPSAALYLYRSLIQRYPNSKDAEAARKIIEKMPPAVLATPPPPASAGQLPAPASRPSFDVH
ncbi:MAG TPA: outer membrane protein assembly factor BamD [Tepidisphaeraceae bacterium]|nr:outer membrane protein assembly factor BamD [Tepidisphaeraceae bacterium]